MRWRTRPLLPPKKGDLRTRHVFAWTPTRVRNMTVWLEFYAVEEIYFRSPTREEWLEVARHLTDWTF